MNIKALEKTFAMPPKAVATVLFAPLTPDLGRPIARLTRDAKRVQMFAEAVLAKSVELSVTGSLYLASGEFESAQREYEKAKLLGDDAAQLLGAAMDLAVQMTTFVQKLQFPKDLLRIGQKKRELDSLNARSVSLRELARTIAERHMLDEALLKELG